MAKVKKCKAPSHSELSHMTAFNCGRGKEKLRALEANDINSVNWKPVSATTTVLSFGDQIYFTFCSHAE